MSIKVCPMCGYEADVTHGDQHYTYIVCDICEKIQEQFGDLRDTKQTEDL